MCVGGKGFPFVVLYLLGFSENTFTIITSLSLSVGRCELSSEECAGFEPVGGGAL